MECSVSSEPTSMSYMSNYENFCLNGKASVNFYDWSNGFGVILNNFYLAAIMENGGLQNSAIQLPPYTFLIMNFYASKDI